MDELVKLVSAKTGLSEEMSRTAVKIVVDYLKTKLPSPLAAQIDSVLAGVAAAGNVEGLVKGLGGLL